MDFLNRAWSLNYIFYFCALPKQAEVLFITDHPGRLAMDFSLFDIKVSFAFPTSLKKETELAERTDILCIEEADFLQEEKEYDLLILDLEKVSVQNVFNKALNRLRGEGYVAFLDWTYSGYTALKHFFKNSGVFGRTISRFPQQRFLKFAGNSFLLEWQFFIEPGLAKPHYLVREAFKTGIPQNSNAAIKNLLNRIGVFYLLPHNQVLLLRKPNAKVKKNPATKIVSALAAQFVPNVTLNDTILRHILLSRTKVLMLDMDLGGKKYIVRFPLDPLALERLQKQQEILSLLQENGITFIPAQMQTRERLSFPYFIEQKIAGIKKQERLLGADRQGTTKLYEQIFPKIEKVHQIFGRHFVMTEKELNKYVKPKFRAVKKLLQNNVEMSGYLDQLQKYFYNTFYNNNYLAGVCHGDLKIQNCIYNSDGTLSGLIDWDMSEKDELTLVDVTSLLANAIRTRYFPKAPLKTFLLEVSEIPAEFLLEYKRYYKKTKTTYLYPRPALMFYWIDRTYKMIKYNTSVDENWARKEILPVLKRMNYFFN